MPGMHLVIPLPAMGMNVPTGSDDQEERVVTVYRWADSEATADPKRWQKTPSNPPLMRTRFISPEPEIL